MRRGYISLREVRNLFLLFIWVLIGSGVIAAYHSSQFTVNRRQSAIKKIQAQQKRLSAGKWVYRRQQFTGTQGELVFTRLNQPAVEEVVPVIDTFWDSRTSSLDGSQLKPGDVVIFLTTINQPDPHHEVLPVSAYISMERAEEPIVNMWPDAPQARTVITRGRDGRLDFRNEATTGQDWNSRPWVTNRTTYGLTR